jgi:hypothetical protein
MLKLENKTRDEIVRALQVQICPAEVGAVLMQIANILSGLPEEIALKKENEKGENA